MAGFLRSHFGEVNKISVLEGFATPARETKSEFDTSVAWRRAIRRVTECGSMDFRFRGCLVVKDAWALPTRARLVKMGNAIGKERLRYLGNSSSIPEFLLITGSYRVCVTVSSDTGFYISASPGLSGSMWLKHGNVMRE